MVPHRGGVGESDLGVSGKEIRIKGNEFCLDEQRAAPHTRGARVGAAQNAVDFIARSAMKSTP